MYVVIARIRAKEGQAEELAGHFREFVDWVTENEADTLTYICNRSLKDPSDFVFFERYTNEKAFEAHSSSDEFVKLTGALQGKLDGPVSIESYEEVAGKL